MERLEKIYSEYKEHGKDMELSISYVQSELSAYEGKIILYGAGSAGIAFYHYLKDAGIKIECFSDGDVEKHGQMCEGIRIIAPAQIVEIYGEDALVIVTINTDGNTYCKEFKPELLKGGHRGVHKSLRALGCKNTIDYTYFRRCYQLFVAERYNLPACKDVYLMAKHWEDIRKVYSLLEDNNSKEIFLKILEFYMLDDGVNIPIIPEKDMYFEYDLFERRIDEVFIDCGAYTGSSLRDFLRINGDEFKKCVCIEPDRNNFVQLANYVNELEESKRNRIEIINAGAYSTNASTHFYELRGPGTFVAQHGPNEMQTVKIDSILQGNKATYIKMNIEGSEIPALNGAKNTICTYKPRLAIMGYHKTHDLWEIPLLMKEFRSDYKLYLKSYMHNIAFTYYAC